MTEGIFHLILEIAEQLVEAGAEIGRVEESISRICTAYGGTKVEAYATLTSIVASVQTEDGTFLTQSRRIHQTGPNMERVHRLNDLARKLARNPLPEDEVRREIEKLKKTPHFSPRIQVLCYGVIGCAFCVFFGGRQISEIVAALVIGIAVGLLAKGMDTIHANRVLNRFVCSMFASLCALVLVRLQWIATADNIIIGNIMSLIPGVGLTNALRDLFTGDTVTGVLRLMEAILLALAIALGFWTSVFLLGGVVQ